MFETHFKCIDLWENKNYEFLIIKIHFLKSYLRIVKKTASQIFIIKSLIKRTFNLQKNSNRGVNVNYSDKMKTIHMLMIL